MTVITKDIRKGDIVRFSLAPLATWWCVERRIGDEITVVPLGDDADRFRTKTSVSLVKEHGSNTNGN